MKKHLITVLLIVILGTVTVTYAEPTTDIDFSQYSLDDLLTIKANLEEEIANRPGGAKIEIGAGNYKIGADLPSGIYTFKYIQNGDKDVDRTDYYVYDNEAMFKYDIDRMWLGDMPREEGYLEGNGETRISLYSGEYLRLNYNGAEIARVGNVSEHISEYEPPDGTTIPTGEYTVGVEIPAGSYTIYYSGMAPSRVRVFEDAAEASNTFNKGKETRLSETNTEGTVLLVDGNIIRVEYTQIIMNKSEGFVFN